MLDLSSFEKALESLKRVYARSLLHPEDEDIRDACIQRFEYSYELAAKMLKRHLSENLASRAELDQMAFRDVIRLGARHGLVTEPLNWFEYREKRNITSHTYDEEKAREVYEILGLFCNDAGYLLDALKQRNA